MKRHLLSYIFCGLLVITVHAQQDTSALKQQLAALKDSAGKALSGVFDARMFVDAFQSRHTATNHNMDQLRKDFFNKADLDPIGLMDSEEFWARAFNKKRKNIVHASTSWVDLDYLFTPIDSLYKVAPKYNLSEALYAFIDTSQHRFTNKADSIFDHYFKGKQFQHPKDAQILEATKAFTAVIGKELGSYYSRLCSLTSSNRKDWNKDIKSIAKLVSGQVNKNEQAYKANGKVTVSYITSGVSSLAGIQLKELDNALIFLNLTQEHQFYFVAPRVGYAIPRDSLQLFSQQLNQEVQKQHPNVHLVVCPVVTSNGRNLVLNTIDSLMKDVGRQVYIPEYTVLEDKPFAVTICDGFLDLYNSFEHWKDKITPDGGLTSNGHGGCIPEWIWNNNLASKYGWATFGTTDYLAVSCGGLDEICSTLGGVGALLNMSYQLQKAVTVHLLVNALDPKFGKAKAWIDQTDKEVKEFLEFLADTNQQKMLSDMLWKQVQELPNEVKSGLDTIYTRSTNSRLYSAYYGGRAGIAVVASFIGLSEIKAILQGTKISVVILKSTTKAATAMMKIATGLRKTMGGTLKLLKGRWLLKINAKAVVEFTGDKFIHHGPNNTEELLASFTNGKLDPKKFLTSGKAVGEPVDGHQLLEDGGKLGWKAVGIKLGTLIDDKIILVQKNRNLPDWIVASFRNKNYITGKTKVKTILYRDFGDKAFMDGSFTTTVNNATRDQLALHPSFNNSMRFKSKIEVPPGNSLDVGKVGKYPPNSKSALPGGADQIILPEGYSHSWIKEIVDSKTGKTYTVSQFKKLFPNLVKNQ